MKDSNVESEEWWKVAKEYFAKGLEKNPAQHKAYERTLRYKLEVYKRKFPEFCLWQSKYRSIRLR
jgi:hypothetical protein